MDASTSTSTLRLCGQKSNSKTVVVFLAQMSILLLAVITALCNLSFNTGTNTELWITILSLSLGSMLPNPNYKKRYDLDLIPAFDTDKARKQEV